MSAKMDEFKEFVSRHPLLKEDVRKNKFTWQNVYEEWVLYGPDDISWKKYEDDTIVNINQNNNEQTKVNETENNVNLDSIKSIMNYVQKLNPDSVNKTLNTVQKVLQIAQTFNGPKSIPTIPQNGLYSDWWD